MFKILLCIFTLLLLEEMAWGQEPLPDSTFYSFLDLDVGQNRFFISFQVKSDVDTSEQSVFLQNYEAFQILHTRFPDYALYKKYMKERLQKNELVVCTKMEMRRLKEYFVSEQWKENNAIPIQELVRKYFDSSGSLKEPYSINDTVLKGVAVYLFNRGYLFYEDDYSGFMRIYSR